ncbi:type II secretion system F family protein [Pedobacter sp. LMG 31464]|uniref:General secretion pathway protein F n=1 Tax=Pedobacter planticolens TaxID=2679964 RepID=A0A923E0E6_9SPHI|nr:type II secretion system F family protein [Pedobacter planticolens]MBB2145788.1 type II secretion system F family protein [Pedobacter planticolens]
MPSIDISNYKSPQKRVQKKKPASVFEFMNKDISFGNGQLSDKKKEGFYHELGTLIRSGIDIKTSLELTSSSASHEKDKQLFASIQKEVIAGKSLSETLMDNQKFSRYEYYSIRIGEETGRLGEVLSELAKYFKNKIQQRRKIIGAITYPMLVLSTSFAAIFFMIKFVVPMFADVFKRFGGKLPYITSLIVGFSDWFDRYIYLLLLLVMGLIAFYVINRKTVWFKKYVSLGLLRMPIVGDILKKIYLARFANTMRLLTGTSTPLLQALGMVRQMITFYPIEQSLIVAEKDILLGLSLSATLAKADFYPVKFIQMIKIAEEVNKLEHFFEQLASQYTEEVEYKTNAISSMLEPLIIIFLGLAVGVILIAMYLPMFQMSNSF